MTDFRTLITPRSEDDEQHFVWDVPSGWEQGRGAYGGLVVGASIRAMETVVDPAQPLRNLTATLTAPVLTGQPGEMALDVLRKGSNTTTITVRLEQEGELRSQITGFFGRRRVEDGDWNEVATPEELGEWGALEPVAVEPPLGPQFATNFEYRVVEGFPFSGAGAARRVAGWVRAHEPGGACDAAYLAGCVDAFWPVALVRESRPRPMSTVGFMMEFVADLDAVDPSEPIFYRATAPASRGGYTAEFRELWSADGELLALNQQTFCIIR